MKELLLFMTDFYGYNNEIIKEIKNRDINVTWFLDKIKITQFERIIAKIFSKYIDKKFDLYFDSCIEKVKGKKFDEILIIFGAAFIKKKHIEKIRNNFPNTKIVYYAWDSVDNFPLIEDLLNLCDISYTFDHEDAKKYNAELLPLFYCEDNKINNKSTLKYDVSTVMSFFWEKFESLSSVLKIMPKNLNNKIYLKIRDKLYYYKFKILKGKKIKEIESYFEYEKLDREAVYKIFCESKAVIDCPLPNQRGLTMRTFEVLSLKRKLITTNKNVVNYDFYCPENIYIIDGDNKYDFMEFINSEFNEQYSLSEKYSLNQFIDKLILD